MNDPFQTAKGALSCEFDDSLVCPCRRKMDKQTLVFTKADKLWCKFTSTETGFSNVKWIYCSSIVIRLGRCENIVIIMSRSVDNRNLPGFGDAKFLRLAYPSLFLVVRVRRKDLFFLAKRDIRLLNDVALAILLRFAIDELPPNMNVNKRMTGMKKIHKTAHWEIARGSAQQNRVYCSKDHNDIFEKGNMITERRGKVDALLKSIREGMKAGGVGKTTLAKYLKCVKGAAVFMNGKSADIAHAYNCEKIVVFDFARCMQEFVNYSIIEAIKNGLIFSPKYESKSLQFKEPAVIVFANDVPCLKQLSEDRWNLMTIENEQLIKLHVNYVDHECKHCKK
ncbi:MREP-like protein [Mya arenaria]|uniref:MREP-like protein n=1 Tax=Mya arenaria TaxID=6604 RepID=A0ABY7G2G5_MYAAR|nr:MREP-like protein [Mya arenaria]